MFYQKKLLQTMKISFGASEQNAFYFLKEEKYNDLKRLKDFELCSSCAQSTFPRFVCIHPEYTASLPACLPASLPAGCGASAPNQTKWARLRTRPALQSRSV
jgi:hypothetical protein